MKGAAPWPERYIPAQSRRSDSVIATQASSLARINSGRPTTDAGVMAPSVVSSNSFSCDVVKLPYEAAHAVWLPARWNSVRSAASRKARRPGCSGST